MPRLTTEERNALVEANIGLAHYFAKYYHASNMEYDDIVQEAHLGLMDAAEGFDPKRGTKFSTYACWHIRKRVMHAIHTTNEIIRTPRRRPSHVCGSLENTGAEHWLEDEGLSPEAQIDQNQHVNRIRECIAELPVRDAVVLRLRHGVNVDPMTLRQIGDILGVSPERVRQLQQVAEEKLCALVQKRCILPDPVLTAEHVKESAQPEEDEDDEQEDPTR